MSASREKKKRFDERTDGVEKRQVRAKDGQKAQQRKKLITAVVAAAVVLVLLFLLVYNSTLFYTGVPAVKAGDWRFTAADFNYEYFNNYYNTYGNIYQSYGDYAYLLLDPNKPLDEQNYAENQTWEQYFEETAFEQLQQMAILNDLGKQAGWSLSAEQKAEIDANIEGLKSSAASQGYSDYKAYIRAMYGKGITEKRLRQLLETSFYATYYSQDLTDGWKAGYTDEEKAAYYDGVRGEYDLVSFMEYFVSGAADDEAGIDAATAMASASATAANIAGAADQATFAEAVQLYAPEDQKATYADPDACLNYLTAPAAMTNAEWKTWLTDPARFAGETKVFESTDGYYVLMYLESNGNEYQLVNLRGIVIPVEKDETLGTVTDVTLSAAEAKVDEILAAYNEDPTEANFAALADQYNTTGTSAGGLQENVPMGQLAFREIEDYLFSDEAQPGAVKSFYNDGNYYVVYPLARGAQYNYMVAENLMAQDQYVKLLDEHKPDYLIETALGYSFTK